MIALVVVMVEDITATTAIITLIMKQYSVLSRRQRKDDLPS